MEQICVKASAKLNLFLDITGRRSDGYHLIQSVMQSVDIFDRVIVSKSDSVSVKCSDSSLDGESNLAYKAAKLFFETSGISGGAKIFIEKHIPLQAGMAGGSADAAAVLFALNQIYESVFSEDDLCTIGAKLGADVPFSLVGGTMLSEGIGEKLSPISELGDCFFVIVKPKVGMSTVASYRSYDEHALNGVEHGDLCSVLKSLDSDNTDTLAHSLFNVLEVTALSEVSDIKIALLSSGAQGAIMTGSGTAVFGIFNDIKSAVKSKNLLSEKYDSVYIARPTKCGVTVDESADVFNRLDSLEIKYECINHPAVYTMEEMYTLGIFNSGIIGKNLFLRDAKGKRHFLVFVYGDKHISLADIQKKLNISRCSFGSQERLLKYLGLTKGAVSPLGVVNDKNAEVEFIIDREFIGCPRVGVHPNRNTSTLWISFDSIEKIIKANGNSINYVDI